MIFAQNIAQLSSIDPLSDHIKAKPLHRPDKNLSPARGLLLPSLLLAPLGACAPEASQEAVPAAIAVESTCGEHGKLSTELFGVLNVGVDWSGERLQCESMLRPDGRGIRLRFTGTVSDEQLAIIIAMPELEPGQSGTEFASNVTVTVEGSGRFFSTPNMDSCWTEVISQEQLVDDEGRYALTGTLYCVTPLGELNGDAAVSMSELTFTSIVDWSSK